MQDKNKHDDDYSKLDKLFNDRIAALDDDYTDSEGKNKDFLNSSLESLKKYLKFRADFLEVIGGNEEKFSDGLIYGYWGKIVNGKEAGKVYLDG
ncbi:MAG: hypothetical protein NY202_02545 [Mollicutes bacterium UO1]